MSFPAGVSTQFKTSNIILNESLIGMEDSFELIGLVNHTYEEQIREVAGMPTNGVISVRRQGIPQLQSGLTMNYKAIEEQYETIQILTSDMIGDMFSVNPVELAVSFNKVTDTTHYQTAHAIGNTANKNCYQSLLLGANIFTGDTSTSNITYDNIADINQIFDELQIPQASKVLFMSAQSYASIAKNVVTTNTFDEELNKRNIAYKLADYGGMPIKRSGVLGTLGFASFYSFAGKTLQFGSLVSSNSYISCVINLTGGTTGDILSPGERLQFEVTTLLNKWVKLNTTVPLQLVVQNTVTANADGDFLNVQCIAGIQPLQQFDDTTDFANFFSNVAAVPAEGENVNVIGSYNFNVTTVKPGFTFATTPLAPMQTLDISKWANGKAITSLNSRNKNDPMAAINIYTAFDADLPTRAFKMRIDTQPVYKTFVDYNVVLVTKYTGAPFETVMRNKQLLTKKKFSAMDVLSLKETVATMQAQIQTLLSAGNVSAVNEMLKTPEFTSGGLLGNTDDTTKETASFTEVKQLGKAGKAGKALEPDDKLS